MKNLKNILNEKRVPHWAWIAALILIVTGTLSSFFIAFESTNVVGQLYRFNTLLFVIGVICTFVIALGLVWGACKFSKRNSGMIVKCTLVLIASVSLLASGLSGIVAHIHLEHSRSREITMLAGETIEMLNTHFAKCISCGVIKYQDDTSRCYFY